MRTGVIRLSVILFIALLAVGCSELKEVSSSNFSLPDDSPTVEIFEASTTQEHDGSWVCRPKGLGPFPAVLYSHGGLGTAIGGDLKGTCEALAEAGFLARSEKRHETVSLRGHLDEVLRGLALLRGHVDADVNHVGVMGFSRGGLLTLQVAIQEGNSVQAVILMAPAHGKEQLNKSLNDISFIDAPVEIYVAENDLNQANHVQLAHDIDDALTIAGKTVNLTIYPSYGKDGHMLFDKVQEPYWSDVLAFLENHLK